MIIATFIAFNNCERRTGESAIEENRVECKTSFVSHPALFNRSASRKRRFSIDTFHRNRVYNVKQRRIKTVLVRCKQEDEGANASELSGELREILERSIQDNRADSEDLRESDRRVVEGITADGATKMIEIVSSMNEDLQEIQQGATQKATEMIQKETDLLLEKYEQKRLDILQQVRSDRQVIQEEITKLEGLTGEMGEKSKDQKPVTEKLLFASTMAFTVAALFYAWNGFVNSDSSSLSNAAVDASVAAAAGYFASRRRS